MVSDLGLLRVGAVNAVLGTLKTTRLILQVLGIEAGLERKEAPKGAFPVTMTLCWYIPWLSTYFSSLYGKTCRQTELLS